jgi:hypothetical protein
MERRQRDVQDAGRLLDGKLGRIPNVEQQRRTIRIPLAERHIPAQGVGRRHAGEVHWRFRLAYEAVQRMTRRTQLH